MANIALRVFTKTHISLHVKIRFEQVRYGHLRGKPPTIALSLQQRLKCKKKIILISFHKIIISHKILLSLFFFFAVLKKPELPKVNIGFSVPKVSEEKKEAMMVERRKKRANSNFEVELRSGKSK